MKNEYISGNGYMLLTFNIVTICFCIITAVIWASNFLRNDIKPQYYKYMLRMLAASLVAIAANSTALARMFDSFLIKQLHLDNEIIKSTVIDRFLMCVTFALLLSAAIRFKKITCTFDDKEPPENV